MSSVHPFLASLKLFYIDNCLYIVLETFTNNNLFEKKFHYSFDADLGNVQFYVFSYFYWKVDSTAPACKFLLSGYKGVVNFHIYSKRDYGSQSMDPLKLYMFSVQCCDRML